LGGKRTLCACRFFVLLDSLYQYCNLLERLGFLIPFQAGPLLNAKKMLRPQCPLGVERHLVARCRARVRIQIDFDLRSAYRQLTEQPLAFGSGQ